MFKQITNVELNKNSVVKKNCYQNFVLISNEDKIFDRSLILIEDKLCVRVLLSQLKTRLSAARIFPIL